MSRPLLKEKFDGYEKRRSGDNRINH